MARWRAAYAAPVAGWDFSHLRGRMVVDEAPWSYEGLAREVLDGARSALDMGTGGGEALRSLADALPADTVATEGWGPNLPVASAALATLGIEVVPYDAEFDPAMPFPADRFDIVLSRYEAYDAAEIARVLRPGGRLLTQQADGRTFDDAQALFGGASAHGHITLANLTAELRGAGLTIEREDEWTGTRRFADVESFLRYVAVVPWEVPDDFTVDAHADVLLRLHDSVEKLVFPDRRFIIQARRVT